MSMYPPGWSRCPVCGDYALDGHLTCGRVECDERGCRDRRCEDWRRHQSSEDHDDDGSGEK